MAKVIIRGIKEDGTIDAECKSTAALVTELIEKLPKMHEADICKALEEIRLSAEQDNRIRQTYARVIKEKNAAMKAAAKVVPDTIQVIKRCAEDHHDLEAVLTLTRLCKAIAGDKFQVKVEENKQELGSGKID